MTAWFFEHQYCFAYAWTPLWVALLRYMVSLVDGSAVSMTSGLEIENEPSATRSTGISFLRKPGRVKLNPRIIFVIVWSWIIRPSDCSMLARVRVESPERLQNSLKPRLYFFLRSRIWSPFIRNDFIFCVNIFGG